MVMPWPENLTRSDSLEAVPSLSHVLPACSLALPAPKGSLRLYINECIYVYIYIYIYIYIWTYVYVRLHVVYVCMYRVNKRRTSSISFPFESLTLVDLE